MKMIYLFLFLLLLISFGCDTPNGPTISRKSDVLVTAYYNEGSGLVPVEGATILTIPASKQGITDNFGSFLLRDINPDTYEIFAKVDGIGSGKTVIKLAGDTLCKVSITIIKGQNTGIAPEITMTLPALPANFTINEKVVFAFTVHDEDSPSEKIKVSIASDKDGKLYEGQPDLNGNVKFETSSLSKGIHIITYTATDVDKYSATKTFQVSTLAPGPIYMDTAYVSNGDVVVKWNKYSGSDFYKYELYRANDNYETGKMIASFSSADSVIYIDRNAPIVSEVYYFVKVTTKESQSRLSSRKKVPNPGGKIYYFNPANAIHHPSEPILYIVDAGENKLRAINYETQTELCNAALQGIIGKIDIGDNGYGLEIYVPSNDGWIYIYNAYTLNLVKTISTGLPTNCVVTNGKGFIVASVRPSPWWEQPVRTYTRNTGINISGNGDHEGDILRFIPNSNQIISISTSVSPVDMEYFELNDNGEITLHKDDTYHGDYALDPNIFKISPNGQFIVTSASGAVYYANSAMTYKGVIPRGSLLFSDFAFSPDGNTIYASTKDNPSIQIIHYPELTRNDQYLLKGISTFIFYYKGKLISLSKMDSKANNFAIESVKVE